MSGLNTAAAGIAAAITALAPDIRAYPTATEAPVGAISAEIDFRGGRQVGPMGDSPWDYEAIVTLSSSALKPNWQASIERLRDYAAPSGSKSLYRQLVLVDRTLGGTVHSISPHPAGISVVRQVKYPDGIRFELDMVFTVRIASHD